MRGLLTSGPTTPLATARRGAARLVAALSVIPATVTGVVLTAPAPAVAHSALLAATPGPGANAAPGVRVMTLDFRRLRGGPHRVAVTGPDDGTRVATAAPVLVDRHILCVAVAPLARPGVYAVAYEIVAADGDRQRSRFYFQVSEAGTPVATPPACRRELPPVPAAGRATTGRPALHTVLTWVTGATFGLMAVMVAAGFAVQRRVRGAGRPALPRPAADPTEIPP